MQITHYELVNGGKGDKKEYLVTVKDNKEIEYHNKKIRKELGLGPDYDVFFHLRMTQQERALFV